MSYTIVSLFTLGVIAQAQVAANWWEPLVGSGPLGVVLFWFMWRSEKRQNEVSKALATNTQSTMVAVLALAHGDVTISQLATKLKAEADKQLNENPDR